MRHHTVHPRACALWLWVSLAAILLALPRAGAAEEAVSRPAYVEPKTVSTWLEAGREVIWLDVRAADEFKAGHILGAINIVFDQVLSLSGRLPHDQPIVVYCIHSTHRAPEAARALKRAGFDNVFVLEGGIVAWQVAGFTIRAQDLAKAPAILPYTERCSQKAQP